MPGLTRTRHDGLSVSRCPRPHGGTDIFLALESLPGERIAQAQARLCSAAAREGAALTGQIAFVRPGLEVDICQLAATAAWPITQVMQADHQTPALCTVARAVSGVAVAPVHFGGRLVGTVYSDALGTVATLGGLYGQLDASASVQTQQVLASMQGALSSCGLDFSDVVRTWYYNHNILDWYGDFNRERTAYFTAHQVFDRLVPASTGIGARNSIGAALTAGVVAVRPFGETQLARAVQSPLQCPAPAYGSSFSRAVELSGPGGRRLFISGTASIAPDGRSVHQEQLPQQVDLTLRVVEGILHHAGMHWADTARAMLYVRRAGQVQEARRLVEAVLPKDLQLIVSVNTVCRDDLLVELELDAMSST